jgi:hypothetical protein
MCENVLDAQSMMRSLGAWEKNGIKLDLSLLCLLLH